MTSHPLEPAQTTPILASPSPSSSTSPYSREDHTRASHRYSSRPEDERRQSNRISWTHSGSAPDQGEPHGDQYSMTRNSHSLPRSPRDTYRSTTTIPALYGRQSEQGSRSTMGYQPTPQMVVPLQAAPPQPPTLDNELEVPQSPPPSYRPGGMVPAYTRHDGPNPYYVAVHQETQQAGLIYPDYYNSNHEQIGRDDPWSTPSRSHRDEDAFLHQAGEFNTERGSWTRNRTEINEDKDPKMTGRDCREIFEICPCCCLCCCFAGVGGGL